MKLCINTFIQLFYENTAENMILFPAMDSGKITWPETRSFHSKNALNFSRNASGALTGFLFCALTNTLVEVAVQMTCPS
jgi:hypothetical protein